MSASAANDKFKIAEFQVGESLKQIYLLNPGDHFDRFGGSSRGLVVRWTASLIVSEFIGGSRIDTEYSIGGRRVWNNIFRAAHLAGYNPPEEGT